MLSDTSLFYETLPPSVTRVVLKVEPVGSRITCNPAPEDTDRDWLVLVESGHFNYFREHLLLDGYKSGGSFNPDQVERPYTFVSLKLGIENILATTDKTFFKRFLAATSVAKKLNLMNKADRVALFQAVLYGNGVKDA